MKVEGVHTGKVMSDAPDELGRVEVEYHELPNMSPLPRAAIATPLSGPERGMYFMPEKNDEVLIAFEKNRFEHPYVIGFLWNGAQRPPTSNHKIRRIKTPGGHTVDLDDEGSKITIKTKGGLEISLDDGTKAISVDAGADGSVSIKGNTIRLEATSLLAVSGNPVHLNP